MIETMIKPYAKSLNDERYKQLKKLVLEVISNEDEKREAK